MDAQAIEIGEPGDAQPSRPDTARSFSVPWGWSLLLFLGVVAGVAFNTAILADEVRVHAIEGFRALPSCRGCAPSNTEPIAFFVIATFAFGLALIAAFPAIVVIGLLGRRASLRLSAISATALLAGLLVASIATRLVTWSARWFEASEPGATIASVLFGPAVEETAKASSILIVGVVMAWRLGIRAGIVLGAAAGLLVTILEIGLYVQLNVAGHTNTAYGAVIAIRLGLFGLGVHVVATAVAGAGIGAWLAQGPPRRWRVPAACVVAAIAIHGLWNLVGSDLMTRILFTLYPNPDLGMPEAFPLSVLFVASSLTQALILGLPIAALVVAWRRDPARATHAAPSSSPPSLDASQP